MGNRPHDPNDPAENVVPPRVRSYRLQNVQASPAVGVPPPPPPSLRIVPPPSNVTANPSRINQVGRSSHRRAPVTYITPAVGSGYGSSYSGSYSGYPYNRSYSNVNMGGMGSSFLSSYGHTYGQTFSQFRNPVIVAAAERSRPAFESIQSVVTSFNAVSLMLENSLAAMQMSFESLLGVAENFTRLRTFMVKLYSAIASFKLARWFLTKLAYLLKMVRGHSGSMAEEELWASLYLKEQGELVSPSVGRSWPFIVFAGILFATPYFVYKLLSSVPPDVPITLSANQANSVPTNHVNVENTLPPYSAHRLSTNHVNVQNRAPQNLNYRFKAKSDWRGGHDKNIPLRKGKYYWTDEIRYRDASVNGGWLLVTDDQGQHGYVPAYMIDNLVVSSRVPYNNSAVLEVPGTIRSNFGPSTIPQQNNMRIVDEHYNPLVLPYPSNVDDDDDDDDKYSGSV